MINVEKLREYLLYNKIMKGELLQDFAIKVGIRPSSLSRILKGTRSKIHLSVAKNIVQATNGDITLEDLGR